MNKRQVSVIFLLGCAFAASALADSAESKGFFDANGQTPDYFSAPEEQKEAATPVLPKSQDKTQTTQAKKTPIDQACAELWGQRLPHRTKLNWSSPKIEQTSKGGYLMEMRGTVQVPNSATPTNWRFVCIMKNEHELDRTATYGFIRFEERVARSGRSATKNPDLYK